MGETLGFPLANLDKLGCLWLLIYVHFSRLFHILLCFFQMLLPQQRYQKDLSLG